MSPLNQLSKQNTGAHNSSNHIVSSLFDLFDQKGATGKLKLPDVNDFAKSLTGIDSNKPHESALKMVFKVAGEAVKEHFSEKEQERLAKIREEENLKRAEDSKTKRLEEERLAKDRHQEAEKARVMLEREKFLSKDNNQTEINKNENKKASRILTPYGTNNS